MISCEKLICPSWRWAYGIATIYGAIVVVLIALFVEETYDEFALIMNDIRSLFLRMYDRRLKHQPSPPPRSLTKQYLRYRIESLVGVTGVRMAKHRQPWLNIIFAPLMIVWRPHLLAILVFEAMVFGFSIGINVSSQSSLFLRDTHGRVDDQRGLPRKSSTGRVRVLSGENILVCAHCRPRFLTRLQFGIAGSYGTPIVCISNASVH